MLSNLITPRLHNLTELIIDNEIVKEGQMHTIRINAGMLPSGNRINVFAHVMHTGIPGPSVLILGGVHGNEINGIEIVRRSFEEGLYNNLKCGTVVVIPLLNVYGFINFSRDVSEGKDVNRSFPGHLNGSLASRVARILTKKILPQVDVAIDFHTGGSARYNYPQIRYSTKDPVAVQMALHTNLRYLIEQPLIKSSFRRAAFDMKVPAVVYEGGESIRLDRLSIEEGIKTIRSLLSALNMMDAYGVTPPGDQWIIHKTSWIRASVPGLFIWSKKAGDMVHKGEVLGEVKEAFGTKSTVITAKVDGHIICHNNASVVSLGDALFHIGDEFSKLKA